MIINRRADYKWRDWFFLCGAWMIGRANRALMAKLIADAGHSIYRQETGVDYEYKQRDLP